MLDEPRPMAPESNPLPGYMQPTGPKVFDQGAASRLPEALRELIKLRDEKDGLDFDIKKLNVRIERQEKLCVELMDNSGTSNTKLQYSEKRAISFVRSHHISVKKLDEAEIIADLDSRGLGEQAKRTINTKTLGKLCRELEDENLAVLRGVEITKIPQVKVTEA